jgi:plastocyanin
MRKGIAGVLLLGTLVAVLVTVGPIATGSAEGRQLVGQFCSHVGALPKATACISLSYDGQTAEGYTNSPDRTIALRPGTYWITVNDTSAMHNFSLESPDGSDQDITGVPDTPGEVTFKVDLTHGTWVLYCDPHRLFGMYVLIDVGGEGQVG